MALTGEKKSPAPGWEAYVANPETAGPFENQVLYAMCRDNQHHRKSYVTAGKVTAIGRIYAAAPDRGAGSGREAAPLADAIGRQLARSQLDERLSAIVFEDRFSHANKALIVETHGLLVREVAQATLGWSSSVDKEGWSPRNHASFASKYLHFHRPNAFPILDRYSRAGLTCAGQAGRFNTYEQFCGGIARHVEGLTPDWTPRSIDTDLVIRGRAHLDRSGPNCRVCGATFRRRSRKQGTIE